MPKEDYVIYTDASADLPAGFAAAHDIRFIPMHYTCAGRDMICDGADEEARRRLYACQREGELTQTTQIAPQTYLKSFEPIVREGVPILSLSLSGGLSGTYSSSMLAARELAETKTNAPVYCVDSLSATVGMGLLLECAVENRENGMSAEDNARWLAENRLRVRHWFVVDDLDYLRRGGRLNAASALVGGALHIKPLLKIRPDGTLVNFAKKRGERAALEQILDEYQKNRSQREDESVMIVHSDNETAAAFLEDGVRQIAPNARVRTTLLSPVIAAHVGPGMCALVHLSDTDRA